MDSLHYDNLALLTDYYQLTMMNGYLRHGMDRDIAVFDVFYRPNDESGYCIIAGLEQALKYVENLRFSDSDIEYLSTLGEFDAGFLEYLRTFRFTGTIRAIPEGTVVFPGEPLVVVEAPICEAQLVETALLNIINFETLIATKACRICRTAEPAKVLEFGLRRAQSPSAGLLGTRATIIGGCVATSNVLAGKMFGAVPRGTHAHSWVMTFPSEFEAFKAYAEIYPNNCLLLVDTYDTLHSGVPNAIRVFDQMKAKGLKPAGIRLDSGDLASLSKRARKMLNNAGHSDTKIFVSGDLDEYVIASLKLQDAAIDTYGVGTRMITSHRTPSLGGVYKLSALKKAGSNEYIPKMKISDNAVKMTLPCKKSVYRLLDNATGMAIADVVCEYDEVIDTAQPYIITSPTERWKFTELTNFTAVPLLQTVMENGKIVCELPATEELAVRCKKSQAQFWDEYLRNEMPHIFKVDLSDKLYETRERMIGESRSSSKR